MVETVDFIRIITDVVADTYPLLLNAYLGLLFGTEPPLPTSSSRVGRSMCQISFPI